MIHRLLLLIIPFLGTQPNTFAQQTDSTRTTLSPVALALENHKKCLKEQGSYALPEQDGIDSLVLGAYVNETFIVAYAANYSSDTVNMFCACTDPSFELEILENDSVYTFDHYCCQLEFKQQPLAPGMGYKMCMNTLADDRSGTQVRTVLRINGVIRKSAWIAL